MNNFSIIVAVDDKMGIGRANDLPWRLSSDMKRFKEVTTAVYVPGTQNVVIMGRKTWESLPNKVKPLPNRINVVITSQKDYQLPQGVMAFSDLDMAIKSFNFGLKMPHGEVFVIGGAQIYSQAIQHPLCKKLYVTHIAGDYSCDVGFPQIPPSFVCVEKNTPFKENDHQMRFCIYEKF
ncbi:MAG: dihydrofolate reductase [Candidatus Omnitrophica bacterium]|nr:dihydrofolate reductase [Candidatus Omnitrophota bacterium]